ITLICRGRLNEGDTMGDVLTVFLGLAGFGERLLKIGHIQREGCIRTPLDRLRMYGEEIVGGWQHLTKVVKFTAQIGQRLAFTGVWPQCEGQVSPRERRVPL